MFVMPVSPLSLVNWVLGDDVGRDIVEPAFLGTRYSLSELSLIWAALVFFFDEES